jgi:hypothetical protein
MTEGSLAEAAAPRRSLALFTVVIVGLLLTAYSAWGCSPLSPAAEPHLAATLPTVLGSIEPSPAVQGHEDEAEALLVAFRRLLQQPGISIESTYRNSNGFRAVPSWVTEGRPPGFQYRHVDLRAEAQGEWSGPGNFALSQTVAVADMVVIIPGGLRLSQTVTVPDMVVIAPGGFRMQPIPPETEEYVVENGRLLATFRTSGSLPLPADDDTGAWLAEFLSLAMFGERWGSTLETFLAFDSVEVARAEPSDGAGVRKFTARRSMSNGSVHNWKVTLDADGLPRQIDVTVANNDARSLRGPTREVRMSTLTLSPHSTG